MRDQSVGRSTQDVVKGLVGNDGEVDSFGGCVGDGGCKDGRTVSCLRC